LRELARAKHYRVADRRQYWDEAWAVTSETPVRFDKDALNAVCEDAAKALFRQQKSRVSGPPPPTYWVQRDGAEAVKAALDNIYPRCREPVDSRAEPELNKRVWGVLPPGHWPLVHFGNFHGLWADPEGAIFEAAQAVFVLWPVEKGSRAGPAAWLQLVAGDDDGCPIYVQEALSYTKRQPPVKVGGSDVGYVRIDGDLTLLVAFRPLYVEDVESGRFLDFGIRPEDTDDILYDQAPPDRPLPGERVLVVHLPPHSPLAPPIARKPRDFAFDQVPKLPWRDKFSNTIIPSCFIYYR
jgi:hypothetical protein